MNRLIDYLTLPSTISTFERSYLKRVNRYAIRFLVLNVPVFVLVAALNGTNPFLAFVTTSLVALGPLLAERVLDNPRAVSRVFAVAGTGLGGLLVHFGQGPMQIEMHFYFFVLIALLTVFGNPSAILLATATTAAHHLVIYELFPSSVFNYQASVMVVVVHAVFVVIESVACCFVARSFFDNVIGLERIVEERTNALAERSRDVRLMLDNLGQGFLRLLPDGTTAEERALVLEEWFGPSVPGERIWEYLGRADPSIASWLELGVASIADDILPLEMALGQMPTKMKCGSRSLSLAYRPITEAGRLTSVLVVVSDITSELARAEAEADNADIVAVFERIMKDRGAFEDFLAEAHGLVQSVVAGAGTLVEVRRRVHTLKGNALLVGMSRFARACHDLETTMEETGEAPAPEQRAMFEERWQAAIARVEALLGNRVSHVELTDEELRTLSSAVSGGRSRHDVLQLIDELRLEPTQRRLERVADDARAVARRLGKDGLFVEIVAGSIRLSPAKWAPLWSSVVHLVRNALDHGIEPPEERVAAGKSAGGTLRLSTTFEGGEFVIAFADDGRGIDWARIAELAERRGLPHSTERELEAVLFSDGVSTKESVSEYSGRGVGMSAVLAAATDLGGYVRTRSEPSRGTRFELRFPRTAVKEPAEPSAARSWGPPSRNGHMTSETADQLSR